ncbi:hypothetical protein BESB_058700 [Besnoitia besnoiti]|uniref:Proteophosphoglycan ppg4, related protein n=1 Tax=Besnoitia besnoiti TaxID=94643 RepID=A0A2A9MH46_BESBE|nr:hypothetical protein BESB_058700 [Besnoitia besnoiti]PFH34983.1 hypothetical protein BESB_058700 [Besnoitia besnoiti]
MGPAKVLRLHVFCIVFVSWSFFLCSGSESVSVSSRIPQQVESWGPNSPEVTPHSWESDNEVALSQSAVPDDLNQTQGSSGNSRRHREQKHMLGKRKRDNGVSTDVADADDGAAPSFPNETVGDTSGAPEDTPALRMTGNPDSANDSSRGDEDDPLEPAKKRDLVPDTATEPREGGSMVEVEKAQTAGTASGNAEEALNVTSVPADAMAHQEPSEEQEPHRERSEQGNESQQSTALNTPSGDPAASGAQTPDSPAAPEHTTEQTTEVKEPATGTDVSSGVASDTVEAPESHSASTVTGTVGAEEVFPLENAAAKEGVEPNAELGAIDIEGSKRTESESKPPVVSTERAFAESDAKPKVEPSVEEAEHTYVPPSHFAEGAHAYMEPAEKQETATAAVTKDGVSEQGLGMPADIKEGNSAGRAAMQGESMTPEENAGEVAAETVETLNEVTVQQPREHRPPAEHESAETAHDQLFTESEKDRPELKLQNEGDPVAKVGQALLSPDDAEAREAETSEIDSMHVGVGTSSSADTSRSGSETDAAEETQHHPSEADVEPAPTSPAATEESGRQKVENGSVEQNENFHANRADVSVQMQGPQPLVGEESRASVLDDSAHDAGSNPQLQGAPMSQGREADSEASEPQVLADSPLSGPLVDAFPPTEVHPLLPNQPAIGEQPPAWDGVDDAAGPPPHATEPEERPENEEDASARQQVSRADAAPDVDDEPPLSVWDPVSVGQTDADEASILFEQEFASGDHYDALLPSYLHPSHEQFEAGHRADEATFYSFDGDAPATAGDDGEARVSAWHPGKESRFHHRVSRPASFNFRGRPLASPGKKTNEAVPAHYLEVPTVSQWVEPAFAPSAVESLHGQFEDRHPDKAFHSLAQNHFDDDDHVLVGLQSAATQAANADTEDDSNVSSPLRRAEPADATDNDDAEASPEAAQRTSSPSAAPAVSAPSSHSTSTENPTMTEPGRESGDSSSPEEAQMLLPGPPASKLDLTTAPAEETTGGVTPSEARESEPSHAQAGRAADLLSAAADEDTVSASAPSSLAPALVSASSDAPEVAATAAAGGSSNSLADPREGRCTREELEALTQHFSGQAETCSAYRCIETEGREFRERLKEHYGSIYDEGQLDELAGLFAACYCRCPMMKCEVDYVMDTGSDSCKEATVEYCEQSNEKFVDRCTSAAEQLPLVYDLSTDPGSFKLPCRVCRREGLGQLRPDESSTTPSSVPSATPSSQQQTPPHTGLHAGEATQGGSSTTGEAILPTPSVPGGASGSASQAPTDSSGLAGSEVSGGHDRDGSSDSGASSSWQRQIPPSAEPPTLFPPTGPHPSASFGRGDDEESYPGGPSPAVSTMPSSQGGGEGASEDLSPPLLEGDTGASGAAQGPEQVVSPPGSHQLSTSVTSSSTVRVTAPESLSTAEDGPEADEADEVADGGAVSVFSSSLSAYGGALFAVLIASTA